jgi:5-formyltetrahydrofolate cyclo-ligase
MPKRSLRSSTLAMRRALTPQQVAERSASLQQRFLSLPEFMEAKLLALYAPIHQEVDTALVAADALASGKTLLYPAVTGDDMEFRRVASMDQFTPGRFGIREPVGDAVDPAAADVIVVPGVAFDLQGRRIGYGKGYYDRCLHRLEGRGMLIAFCFEFQLFEEIVGEPHDVAMDLIVTEGRVVRVNKNIS